MLTGPRLAVTHSLLVMTAQVVLSGVFIAGYFFILHLFVSGKASPPPEYKEMVISLLGVLTAGVGMVLAYWFQRQRSPAPQGE